MILQIKPNNIPPSLDLRQLPIYLLTGALREWAQNMVINALNTDTPYDTNKNDKLLKTLLPYLCSRTNVSWWQKLLNWWQQRIISQILMGFPQTFVDKIQQNPVAVTIVQSLNSTIKFFLLDKIYSRFI